MRGRLIALGLFFCASLLLTHGSGRRNPAPQGTLTPGLDYVQGEVLITFAGAYAPTSGNFLPSPPSSGSSAVDSVLDHYEGVEIAKLVSTFDACSSAAGQQLERMYVYRYGANIDAQDMLDSLSALSYFDDVSLNLIVEIEPTGTVRTVPGDSTLFADQWYFDNDDYGDSSDIDLPEAWAIEAGGDPDLVIGIFDEGTYVDTVTNPSNWRIHSDFNHFWNGAEDQASPDTINGADLDGDDSDGDGEGEPVPPYVYEANIIGFNLLKGYDADSSPGAEYRKRYWYGLPLNYQLCPDTYPPPLNGCTYPSWEIGDWRRHGVWVASIAAAKLDGRKPPNDHADIVGVAYNCQVYWGRFTRKLPDDRMVGAIYHLAKKVQVLNMSFTTTAAGVPKFPLAIQSAARDDNCVLVASTGNWGTTVGYPARFDDVLAVGATRQSPMTLWQGSNWDSAAEIVDVVAPMEGLDGSPVADSFSDCDGLNACAVEELAGHIGSTGTSFAAPQASGVAALVRSRFPSLRQDGVRTRIKTSAEFYWEDNETNRRKYGSGKLNAYRALTEWGPITGAVTWSTVASQGKLCSRDGVFYVSGDITIEDGGSLTIDAGAIVKVAPDHEEAGSDTTRVEIIVKDGGVLNIEGTSGDPVVFESFTDSSPTTSDWVGIQFEPGSTGSLEHVVIRNAETAVSNFSDDVEIDYARIEDCEWGIEVWEDISVSHSVITDCEDYGVYVRDGTATLTADTISYCGVSGVDMAPWSQGASGLSIVSSSYLHHNEDYGIHLSGAADSLHLSSSTVRENEHGVAVATGARACISGSTLSSNEQNGVLAYSTSSVAVTGCEVDSNGTNGIYCLTSSHIVVKGDSLRRNVIGIYCNDESSPTIGGDESGEHNYIKYNTAGIKCEDESSPEITWNQISYNGDGVCALDDAEPSLGNCDDECPTGTSCGGNSIHDNTGYHVSNLTQGVTIFAECNYWGPRGPQANKFSGTVDYSPDLGSFNPVPAPGVRPDAEPLTPKLPERYAMGRSVPNPFNPSTTLHYEVPKGGGDLSIVVYDVQGKLVKRLYGGHQIAGYHRVEWDGRNDAGADAATGVYFVQMRAKAFVETRKVVLIK